MTVRDSGNIKVEYGRVQSINNVNGSARLKVFIDRLGRTMDEVLVEKIAPGCLIVPQRGWWVEVQVHDDGLKVMSRVLSGPEVTSTDTEFLENPLPGGNEKEFSIDPNLNPGELILQLDRNTAIYASKETEGDSYDLELHSGNDIEIRSGGQIRMEDDIDQPDNDSGLTQGNRENNSDDGETTLADIEDKLDSLSTDISNLQNDVDNLQSDVNNLDDRVTTLEGYH